MKGTNDGWAAVGKHVTARFAELSMSKAAFSERTGVSFHTLNAAMRGEPIQRADKRGDIAVGLGWTRDSIDRILAGDSPTPATSSTIDGAGNRLDAIDGRLDRIENLLEQLVDESRATS